MKAVAPQLRLMPHEHDPSDHVCAYRGWNAWECGHIDGNGSRERCDCGCCTGTCQAVAAPAAPEAQAVVGFLSDASLSPDSTGISEEA